ncbi:transforming growth factor-beta-induced protein ig-h3-like [Elysia marginata]|uniref:Transforming growth factor-beta-induced protein ig-h3-like n=1 Tax=Elysia marginata TaxID=1093978 RepID=A0AAV4H316_9GAST|nr:transforming growth factor-beta-induced protein ig-h3-like [Elysia marginata]
MNLFPIVVVIVLAAGSCTAKSMSHYLDVNIDNVKKMVLEYDPLVRSDGEMKELDMPIQSFAMRMFHENILKAENEDEPIPVVATNLGLTELVQAVVKAGLKATLESAGPFTVFGPTNEAFQRLPEWAKQAVANVTVLADVLKYHVLSGKVESKSLKNELQVATVEGKKLRINLYTKEGKTVATAQCAPIDLMKVDQAASNGVIHVLNAVMLPPAGTIVSALAACPEFKILVKAVQVGGLVETLSGPGPFTVFAPTDKAFRKLPQGTIEKLLHNPKELAKILTYHVVSGTFCSAGLSSGNVKTVEGQEVAIKVSADGVVVNESKVISADGSVTNGVVHAIDTVLLPPGYVLP